jgi:hypothetical protein
MLEDDPGHNSLLGMSVFSWTLWGRPALQGGDPGHKLLHNSVSFRAHPRRGEDCILTYSVVTLGLRFPAMLSPSVDDRVANRAGILDGRVGNEPDE